MRWKVRKMQELLFRHNSPKEKAKPAPKNEKQKKKVDPKKISRRIGVRWGVEENDVMNDQNKAKKSVSPLTFSRLKVGMMMMGYIRGVDRDRLLVGLPFGLVG